MELHYNKDMTFRCTVLICLLVSVNCFTTTTGHAMATETSSSTSTTEETPMSTQDGSNVNPSNENISTLVPNNTLSPSKPDNSTHSEILKTTTDYSPDNSTVMNSTANPNTTPSATKTTTTTTVLQQSQGMDSTVQALAIVGIIVSAIVGIGLAAISGRLEKGKARFNTQKKPKGKQILRSSDITEMKTTL